MTAEKEKQFIDRINQLVPIGELSPKLRMKLLDCAQIIEWQKNHTLFKQGDRDNFSFYLLKGEVELFDDKQYYKKVIGGKEESNYTLAQLQPRPFSAVTKTDVTVLQIDKNILDQFLVLGDQSSIRMQGGSIATVEGDEANVSENIDWMAKTLQSGIFSRVPVENMQQLFSLLEPIKAKAGDIIVKQGDIGEYYYIISSGHCEIFRKPSPSSSKEVKLAELVTGDSFGEEALISGSKRNATVKMITDGVIMRLSKDDFIDLIKKPALVSVSFSQAKQLNEEGAIWLDMRYPNERNMFCIEGSINIPLNLIRLQANKLDKGKKYIAHCDTGRRSAVGTFLLTERGYDVCYLENGLANNPAAFSGEVGVPAQPVLGAVVDEENDLDIDAAVEAAVLEANLETTKLELSKAKEAMKDADKKIGKQQAGVIKALKEESKKLEEKKKTAERIVQQDVLERERKLQEFQEQAKKYLQEEQKNLDAVYEKNAADMEQLQSLKEASKRKLQIERERIQEEAAGFEKKVDSLDASFKRRLEESRRLLEKQEKKNQQKQKQLEDRVQAKAKAMIEEEKRKLVEQYGHDVQEFEKLQRSKVMAEAARQAAQQEARKIIEEFKLSHEQERTKETKKIQQEHRKLQEEAKKIKLALEEFERTKADAEKAKQIAMKEANLLRIKQKKLDTSIKTHDTGQKADQSVKVSKREDMQHTSSQGEDDALAQQIAADLIDWKIQQEKEASTDTAVPEKSRAELMYRIKKKAEQAKKEAQQANSSLLDDIKKQLES